MAVEMMRVLTCSSAAKVALNRTVIVKSRFPQKATRCKSGLSVNSVLGKGGVSGEKLGASGSTGHRRSCRPVLLSSSFVSMAGVTAQKQVIVPIANDTEEMEAVIIADVLRRAGADVKLASVENALQITASRKVKLVADTFISSCDGQRYDLIVLPGGMPGAARLRDSTALETLVKVQAQQKRLYAAVCAAPAVALETWGLLDGLKATCHPSFTEKLRNKVSAESRVVQDGLVTTSRGPGTCFEFALSLVGQLYGKDKMNEISTPLVLRPANLELSADEYNFEDWTSRDASAPFRVLVPVANGSEEMEAVIIVDVLRRAGFEVIVASVEDDLQVVASRKVKIVADALIADVAGSHFDAVILPGGMPGAEHLRDCDALTKILRKQVDSRKIIGAICASPAVVLQSQGFLKGKKATSFPSFSGNLPDQSAVDSRVVIDGRLITSRGPGTSMEFALTIVEKILGYEKASSMAEAMVLPYSRVPLKQMCH